VVWKVVCMVICTLVSGGMDGCIYLTCILVYGGMDDCMYVNIYIGI
jgi:hypothetical protein